MILRMNDSDGDDTQDELTSVGLNSSQEQNLAILSMLRWFCTLLANIYMKHQLTPSAILIVK